MSIEPGSPNVAFRLGLGTAGALVWGAATAEYVPGLAAVFAVNLLVPGARPPGAAMAALFVVYVGLASVGVAFVTGTFLDHFGVLVLILLLLLQAGFRMAAIPGPARAFGNLLLVIVAVIPPYAVGSLGAAWEIVSILVTAAFRAVVIAVAAHALLPDPRAAARPVAAAPPPGLAIVNAAIALPALLFYMLAPDRPAFTALIGLNTFLALGGSGAGRAHLGVRILGNLAGGACAMLAAAAVAWRPSLPVIALCALLGALFLSGRIVLAGPATRPWLVMALCMFLTLFGLEVSPQGFTVQPLWRVFDVAMLGLYGAAALQAVRVLGPRPRPVAA